MNKILIRIAILILLLLALYIKTASAFAPAPDPTVLANLPVPEIIKHFSTQYNVSYSEMYETVKCESSFNTKAIGDNNGSFGISQINLRWNPEVTKEQAFDPVFAAEFMAKKFSQGKADRWTCWRKIYQ